MEKLKAILVDDEESARNILKALLERFCPEIELIGSYTNVPDAVDGIRTLSPDLVFLDIEMPNYTGFEIVSFFEEINFEMIFITAYDKYAIKAFEVSAVDYLLKPIEIDRLKEAVHRVNSKLLVNSRPERISHLTETLKSDEITSIIITDKGNQHVIQLDSIIAIEAQESYSSIHTTTQRYVVSKNLKHFENLTCENDGIIRVHKSWIVNVIFMENFSRSKREINLQNGIIAKLSKYRKSEFEAELLNKRSK